MGDTGRSERVGGSGVNVCGWGGRSVWAGEAV